MINIQNAKFALMGGPELKNNAAFSATATDTQGYDYVTVLVALGATDIATTGALKVQHCDTSGGTYADVTGAVFSAAFSSTDDNKLYAIFMDRATTGLKRYIKISGTAGNGSTGTNLCTIAIMTRGNVAPTTATLRGLAEQVIL
jgi:hypothetical protein